MQADAVAYKCPSCGASLSFNAATQGFDCEFCGGHYDKSELDKLTAKGVENGFPEQQELDPQREEERESFVRDSKLYICPGCGAQVITESELSASAICHYCHSPIVLSGRLSGEYCPDLIIPFVKTEEQALEGFESWTAKYKFFMAKGFGAPDSLSKIRGVYVPYWLCDSIAEGTFAADCYKTLSSVRNGDYIVKTEAKHMVVRQGTLEFEYIPADGSLKAEDALTESIEPFDYTKLTKFEMAYLSGHYAEKYSVTKEKVYPRIERRVLEETRKQFRDSVKGYSRMEVKNEFYRVKGVRWNLALLPLWFLTYNYKGKQYYYAMNGQTGKFGGTIPINKLKLALFSFGIPGAIALLLFIIVTFFG